MGQSLDRGVDSRCNTALRRVVFSPERCLIPHRVSFRVTAILLLIQQAVWLGVIVPGHERGSVRLPGYEAAGEQAATSCHADHACCANKGDRDTHKKAPADPSHCAICHIAARLVVATPPDFVPAPTDLIAAVPEFRATPGPLLCVVLPYEPTGPPMA